MSFKVALLLLLLTEVSCQGDVRLRDGPTQYSGRVEVRQSGVWGTVCSRQWTEVDASVVCRELGYESGGRAVRSAAFGEGSGPIHLSYVGCSGGESSIMSCDFRSGGSCDHAEDAGVLCETEDNANQTGELRLSDGGTNTSGRVEVQYYGAWGSVCWDNFGQAESQVACKDLGYCGGSAVKHDSYFFGVGTGPIWLSEVTCEGHEDHLHQCQHTGWGENQCEHYTDVGVVCQMCATGDLRLYGSDDNSSGIVTISNNGVWGTICSEGWADMEARVACQQLGYLDGVAISNKNFSKPAGPIWLSGVSCTGWETQLTGCTRDPGWGDNDCRHYQDVAVHCLMTPVPTTKGSTSTTTPITTVYQTLPSTTKQPDDKNRNTIVIVGVVVGAVTVIVIVVSVVYSVTKIKTTTKKHSILVTQRGQQNDYAVDNTDGACALTVIRVPNHNAKCRGSGVYQEIPDRVCESEVALNKGRNSYATDPTFNPSSRMGNRAEPLPEIPNDSVRYVNNPTHGDNDGGDHHYAAIPEEDTDHYLTPIQLKI